jgi:peptidoglycan/LPS O-acetylase OafA/YrhL
MGFGHLAVVVFIVLSGYSLAIGPARRGWQLGGVPRFLGRRAWRILPPYWAALAFSLAIAWTIVPQPGEGVPTARSAVVFGLLLQDVTGSPSPNGAFWSIAIEAHLYLVLPLMLLLRRRRGPVTVLVAVGLPALAVAVLGPFVPAVALFDRFVPQMAVLFALGVVTAGVTAAPGVHGRPWGRYAVLAALPPLLLIALAGTPWTVDHFFWVDLLAGPAIAFLLVGVASGRTVRTVRLLDGAPLRKLGAFSYSLYLVHAPIVVAVHHLLTKGQVPEGVPTLLVLLGVAATLSVGFAWLFASVFELPFQRHRSARALREAIRSRIATPRAAVSTSGG